MKYIKENIFLLATALVLIAGSAAIYVFGSSANEAADKGVADRQQLANKMGGLSAKPVNAKVVESAKAQIQSMQEAAKKVVDFCLERSSHNTVITLSPSENEKVPVFPMNEKRYRDESLGLLFPRQYIKDMQDLLAIVKAVAPPTAEDLRNEATRFGAKDAAASPGNPGVPAMPDAAPGPDTGGRMQLRQLRGMGERGGDTAVRPMTPVVQPTGGDANKPVEDTAETKAMRNLIWKYSREGWIYADRDSLFIPSVMTETGASKEYDESELWMAQVGMWVQKDVLQAIQKTNEAAQKANANEEVQGVAASAVKRLVNFSFHGYCMKGSAGGGKLAYLHNSMTRGADIPPGLTGRVTCPAYDVLHYDFTVVIPMGYLRELYKNLRLQNFHTVLDVQIEPVTDPTSSGSFGSSPMGSSGSALSPFYYGTEPVVQVTIVGELLVMADASRGRMDPNTKQWDPAYPPLMPKAILNLMKNLDASAIRPEDTARMSQSGNVAGGAPGGAARPLARPRATAGPAAAPGAE